MVASSFDLQINEILIALIDNLGDEQVIVAPNRIVTDVIMKLLYYYCGSDSSTRLIRYSFRGFMCGSPIVQMTIPFSPQ